MAIPRHRRDVVAATASVRWRGGSHITHWSVSTGGYIAKYNDPPVRTFLSICGCNAGVAAWPQCSPAGKLIGPVCRALAEVLGDLAYLKIVQDILFQANYYRDPLRLQDDAYLANSRLARWNGESHATARAEIKVQRDRCAVVTATAPPQANATWKANFLRTDRFVWVEGTKDTVVFPRAGEQWAAPDPADPWKDVQAMKQTAWYAFVWKSTFNAPRVVVTVIVSTRLC